MDGKLGIRQQCALTTQKANGILDVELLESKCPEDGHKRIQRMEHLTCEDRLRELGAVRTEEKNLGKAHCSLAISKGKL